MLVHGQTIEYHRPGSQFDHVKTSPIQLLILSRASSSRTMEGRWLNPLRTNLKISPFPPGPGTVVVGRHLLTLAFDARRAIMNNQLVEPKTKGGTTHYSTLLTYGRQMLDHFLLIRTR